MSKSIVVTVAIAIVRVAVIAPIISMSKSIVAIKKIRVSLSFGSRSSLCISRSLAIQVGIAIVATIVSTIVTKTVSIVSVPGVCFSFGISTRSRNRLSLGRSLSVVAVVGVAVVAPIMSKSIVASIQKIRVSLCLCFRFRLAHGKDGQAEKSQDPEHTADAEVGWKCLAVVA